MTYCDVPKPAVRRSGARKVECQTVWLVAHFWHLLSDIEIPYATLLDLDAGRQHGGPKTVQYVVEQLAAVGNDLSTNKLVIDEEIDLDELDEIDDQELINQDQNHPWLKALRREGVFFSSPLDIDFSMLAIRMTYPVIFLDEFQDAQRAQFQLLTSAFDKDYNTFTAVGDGKQRIMGWAGAMPNGFEVFTQQFDARPISLLLNWRSHTDLVAIQHIVAQSIDPNVEHAVARGEKAVDGDICAIWDFGSEEEEIEGLAGWISEQVDDGIGPPSPARTPAPSISQ